QGEVGAYFGDDAEGETELRGCGFTGHGQVVLSLSARRCARWWIEYRYSERISQQHARSCDQDPSHDRQVARGGAVPEGRSRRKRGSLSPEEIVAAALAVLDREGEDTLTFAHLGEELKASPTAVYRHFASRADLVRAMADHL